jgi:hypothetical protein
MLQSVRGLAIALRILLRMREFIMTTEERLLKIERELIRTKCRVRWFVGIGLTSAVVMLLIGWLIGLSAAAAAQQQPRVAEEIVARRITLVDDDGATQAELLMQRDGPSLVLYDDQSRRAVLIGISGTSTHLSLGGSGPHLLLSTDRGPSGSASLSVSYDSPTVSSDGEIHGAEHGATLFASALGTELFLEGGMTRAKLGAYASEAVCGSALQLYDPSGCERVKLRVGKDGPALKLDDQNGTARAVLGTVETKTEDGKITTYPESSLVLFDVEGKVRWLAP